MTIPELNKIIMRERTIIFAERPWVKNLGVAIAIITFVVSIYMWFFYRKAPNYKYEIVSHTTVLAENAEVPYIKILVDSVDIHHTENNISIVEIKVLNSGKASLRRDDYDFSDFGLNITNGHLLGEPKFSSASTNHIVYCLATHNFRNTGSFINMPILPLDSKDYYLLKLAVLHKNNERVRFEPIGKIIGQKEIEVEDAIRLNEPFLSRLLDENIWMHLLRFLLYFLVLFGGITVCVSLDDRIRKDKKKRQFSKVIKSENIDNDVVNTYLKLGERQYESLIQILNVSEKELYKKYMSSLNFTKSDKNKTNLEQWMFHKERATTIKYMLQNKYLYLTGEQISVNKRKKKSALELYNKLLVNNLMSYVDKEQELILTSDVN